MKNNMGLADRVIRLLLAVMIFVLWYTNVISGIWSIVLLSLAAIFVLISFAGYCPLYSIFGINTCPRESNQFKSDE